MGHSTERHHGPGGALLRAIAVTLITVTAVVWVTTPAPLVRIDIAEGTALVAPDFAGNRRIASVDSAKIDHRVPAGTYAHWSKWLVLFRNVEVADADDESTISHAEFQFINARSGKVAGSLDVKERFGTTGFLPDGRFIVMTSPWANQGTLCVHFFDPRTGESHATEMVLWDDQTESRYATAEFRVSNNRSTLAIRTHSGDIEFVDIARMVRTTLQPGPMRSTSRWDLSPDGTMVAICSEVWSKWKKFGHGIDVVCTRTGQTLRQIKDLGPAPAYRDIKPGSTLYDNVTRSFDSEMTDYWGKTESQAWGVNTLGFDKSGTRLWWSTSRAVGSRGGFKPDFETPAEGTAPTAMIHLESTANTKTEVFAAINRNVPEVHWYREDNIHAQSMDGRHMLIREDRESDGVYVGKYSRNYRVATSDQSTVASWPDGSRPPGALFAKEQFVPESNNLVFVHVHTKANKYVQKHLNPLLAALSIPIFQSKTVTQTTCFDWVKQRYTTVSEHPRKSVRAPFICQPRRVALTVHEEDSSRLEVWSVPANNFERSWTLALAFPFALMMYWYFRCPVQVEYD